MRCFHSPFPIPANQHLPIPHCYRSNTTSFPLFYSPLLRDCSSLSLSFFCAPLSFNRQHHASTPQGLSSSDTYHTAGTFDECFENLEFSSRDQLQISPAITLSA